MGHADPKLGTQGRRIGAVAGIFIGGVWGGVITALPAGGYGVVLTLRDMMTSGPIGKVLGVTAVRKPLTGVTGRLLARLEHHAKTGQDVGQGFLAKAA